MLVYCKGCVSTKQSPLSFLSAQMSTNIKLVSSKHNFLYYPVKHILCLHSQYTKEIKAIVCSTFKGLKKEQLAETSQLIHSKYQKRFLAISLLTFKPWSSLAFSWNSAWFLSGAIRYRKVTTPFCTDNMTAIHVCIISTLVQHSLGQYFKMV